MKPVLALVLGAFLTGAPLQAQTRPPAAGQARAQAGMKEAAFKQLLKEADIILDIPAGYHEIPVPETEVYDFDKAWRKADGTVEIRLAIRPIARVVIDYDDPHGSAPDPNDVHGMVFAALLGQLSTSGELPERHFPPALARKTFNAEWASVALMGIDPAVNTSHREGMLLGIHKSRVADAYLLVLYDNPEKSRALLNGMLKLVRFGTATPQAVLKARAEADRKAREGFLEEGNDPDQCIPPEGAHEVRKSGKDLDQSPRK